MDADSPRKRGRPPGSRNKPLEAPADTGRMTPPTSEPNADYRHADPDTIIARQLSMIDWAQQALRNEMQRAYQSKGISIQTTDLSRLETLSNTIVRTIDALKKSADAAEELAKRMSAEQLIEAAAKKIEGQDASTLRYYIKRFRAYLERIAPATNLDKVNLGEYVSAADSIAELDS